MKKKNRTSPSPKRPKPLFPIKIRPPLSTSPFSDHHTLTFSTHTISILTPPSPARTSLLLYRAVFFLTLKLILRGVARVGISCTRHPWAEGERNARRSVCFSSAIWSWPRSRVSPLGQLRFNFFLYCLLLCCLLVP
jgi:hypothetical protein